MKQRSKTIFEGIKVKKPIILQFSDWQREQLLEAKTDII